VIVADTSAWIEFLRDSPHPAAAKLDDLLDRRADLAITEVVLMEVLAGRRSGDHVEQARDRLMALPLLRLEGAADFEEAARIYRACRDAGHTIRSQLDLLIALPVIRHGASLLHGDRDFEVIARHSALKLEPLTSSSGKA
jgi:predicted nucleic acid-binding protein